MTDTMNKYIQSITDLLAIAHISDMGRKPDSHSIPRVAATIIAELVNDAAAYKKQVDTLQRELDKAQDEINCAESALEAFSCEFEEEAFNQGFDCLGDFVQALWKASNGQRDALQAKLDALEKQEPVAIVDDSGIIVVCSYKYKAGDKLYTAPKALEPLSEARVKEFYESLKDDKRSQNFTNENWFQCGIATAEAAHGITKGTNGHI